VAQLHDRYMMMSTFIQIKMKIGKPNKKKLCKV